MCQVSKLSDLEQREACVCRFQVTSSTKIIVWWNLYDDELSGLYFFDQTLNSECHLDFFAMRFIPICTANIGSKIHGFRWTPLHSAEVILDLLRSHYGHNVISRAFSNHMGDGHFSSPYRPNLSSIDFVFERLY